MNILIFFKEEIDVFGYSEIFKIPEFMIHEPGDRFIVDCIIASTCDDYGVCTEIISFVKC